jgi:uncharacterized Zn ribbon protein
MTVKDILGKPLVIGDKVRLIKNLEKSMYSSIYSGVVFDGIIRIIETHSSGHAVLKIEIHDGIDSRSTRNILVYSDVVIKLESINEKKGIPKRITMEEAKTFNEDLL